MLKTHLLPLLILTQIVLPALLMPPAAIAQTPPARAERSVADSVPFNQLQEQITEAYQARQFDALIAHATKALDIARAGGDHMRERLLLVDIAHAHAEAGRYSESVRYYVLARERYRTARDFSGKEVAADLAPLSHAYMLTGDYAKALPLLQRSLVSLSPVPISVDEVLAQGVELYLAMGHTARALPLAHRAVINARHSFGVANTGYATSLDNIVRVCLALGKHTEALPLAQRSAALNEQEAKHVKQPDVYPKLAESLQLLARVHAGLNEHAKALPLYQRALTMREKLYVPDHPLLAETRNALAHTQHALGNKSAAQALAQRALASREKMPGAAHPDVAQSLHTLAMLAQANGDTAQASTLAQRALSIREKALGREHPDVAHSLELAAALYTAAGDTAKAQAATQRATAISQTFSQGQPKDAALKATLTLAQQPD
jgi:tetratricopeptide (TPR) repeat protein